MMTMEQVLENEKTEKRRHIVPVSGGKDSAALAVFMKQTYPQLPLEFVFSDTDSELPETYEFLEKLEALLGMEVNRINALDMLGV
jgi:3'-phosphoadenosine 5'-phosphosulfate sulfotransferase (PAPS reductase)/FAD synthetase